ncbi:MAG: branched-chain amino acid ABC transporter permease [Actinomycetota bacterium]|nr:branched-chain amino acid ABC transporter permease [Actinomycetota bacterium]
MTYFLTLLLNGLSLGCIYGLIAFGFVIVFKATRVLNFAHGSVLLLGAYTIGRLHDPIGFPLALLAGIATAALAGVIIDTVVLSRVRNADGGTLAILMIGVDILMLTELTRRIGNQVLTTGAPWGSDVVELGDLRLPMSRVIAGAVAVVLFGALAAVFKLTDWGVAMRAAAADGETASLMGIRLQRTGMAAWALAGALAAVAGLFLTSFPSPGIVPAVSTAALAAIPAWVLGGFDSIPGAIVGGLVIGVVSSLTAGYESDLAFLGRGLGEVTPWLVMILVLLVRPSGLFGERGATRV